MIDVSKIKSGKHFYHHGIGEDVFDKDATADVLGCSKVTLCRLNGKNALRPLKARWKGHTVYAKSDIEAYLAKR